MSALGAFAIVVAGSAVGGFLGACAWGWVLRGKFNREWAAAARKSGGVRP